MVESLVSLVAAALALMTTLIIASRIIPDDYDDVSRAGPAER